MSMSKIRSLVEAVDAPKYDTDAIYKGAALLQNALNYTKDKELADYKIAKEAEKEKQAQENWQKSYDLQKITNDIAKETHDIAMADHKRKLGTEEMTKSLSKVGTALPAEYTDISSLLPKYASVANTAANKAYDKVLAETNGNEDAALDAYSKTANDIGKTLFSQQQNELKYNRDAVSQARDILRQNIDVPNGYDSVAVTQNLATLDKPFDTIITKNRDDLAANLIGSVRNSKDLSKINDTYLKATGTTLPAVYQLKANDIVRDIEQRKEDNKLKLAIANIGKPGAKDATANMTDQGKAVYEKNNLQAQIATNAKLIANINFAKKTLDPKSKAYQELTTKAESIHQQNQSYIKLYKELDAAFEHKYTNADKEDKGLEKVTFSDKNADKFIGQLSLPAQYRIIGRNDQTFIDSFFADPDVRKKLENSKVSAKHFNDIIQNQLKNGADLEDVLENYAGHDLW